jgi:hypothetical protein
MDIEIIGSKIRRELWFISESDYTPISKYLSLANILNATDRLSIMFEIPSLRDYKFTDVMELKYLISKLIKEKNK